jgi:hypothetical protein
MGSFPKIPGTSMDSFKTGPLSSLLLVGLLAWIAFVLIAPQVDLEKAAFRSKDSPLSIHESAHSDTNAEAAVSAPGVTLPSTDASRLALEVFIFDRAGEVHPIPPRILRC